MKRPIKVNVLFTSAGRRLELLRAFRKSYNALGLKGNIVATDADPLAPALSIADKVYIVPKMTSPEYLPKLISICKKEEIRLVFPLIDPDIFLLAENREQIANTGAKAVVVPLESVLNTRDKWLTHKFFERIGIRHPKYWLPQEIKINEMVYPLFIKPRFGSAGKDAFKIKNSDELKFFLTYVPDPIVEEFLPGPEITNDVLCDLEGKVLSVISRERIEVRSGEVQKGITIYNKSIMHYCVEITKALNGVGQITVQCIMRDHVPYFTEINARFGGGAPLGIKAGCDAPRWLLSQAAGLDFDVPPLGQYELGLYLSRYDESIFYLKDYFEKFASSNI